MKKNIIPFLCLTTLLSACSSTARQVNRNSTTENEPIPDTTETVTQVLTPTISLPTQDSYDVNSKIRAEISGEIKENFEYLVDHLSDTSACIKNIYLGSFTQNKNSEILVEYSIENIQEFQGYDHTFLFVLDLYTGELLTSYYLTADQVQLWLLSSPMGTKIFVTQNGKNEDISYSNASIFSCLDGIWSPSSAISSHSTVISAEDGSFSQDFLYTYNGEILTIESQFFSEESPEEPPTVELHGTYVWNTDLSIFQNAMD